MIGTIRAVILWVTGLIASFFIGGGIAALLFTSIDASLFGPLVGVCTFTCARLWLTEQGNK
jgi:hypothetical protein